MVNWISPYVRFWKWCIVTIYCFCFFQLSTDQTMTLTVDGKTAFTYQDPNPFETLESVTFVPRTNTQVYYNCTSNPSNDVRKYYHSALFNSPLIRIYIFSTTRLRAKTNGRMMLENKSKSGRVWKLGGRFHWIWLWTWNLFRIGLREMDCDYYYQTTSTDYEYFDLASLADAKPDGYKVNLNFSVVGTEGAKIILSEGNTLDNEAYLFGRYCW